MIKIERTGKFLKMLEELSLPNENLEQLILEKIKLFANNPTDTRLRNHALTKRMEGKWAFSITADIRIVYKWSGKNTIRFLAIGKHLQAYGR